MEASNLLSGTLNGSFNFTTEDVHGYNLTNNDTLMVNGSENTTNPLCELNAYCEPVEDYVDRLYEDIYPDTGKWILIAVYIITFIVGLVGNVLVCFAIWRNPNMRTVTNIYIVNLSLADLAVIIVCLPSVLLQDVTLTWFFGTFFCKISLFLMVSIGRNKNFCNCHFLLSSCHYRFLDQFKSCIFDFSISYDLKQKTLF